MSISELRNTLGDYAKDIKINLGNVLTEEGAPVVVSAEQQERQEAEELRSYLLAWARSHGEEYHYLFGPASFERLATDMAQEFNIFRRRA